MENEEFLRLLNLAKISEKDPSVKTLKEGTEKLISEAEKISGFSFDGGKDKEGMCNLREDSKAPSVSRRDILKNTKDSDGEFFILPEGGELS